MALSHSDHKRIALSISQELKKVLSGANAKRLLDKHAARVKPDGDEPAGAPEDSDSMDEMMREMEEEHDRKAPSIAPEDLKSRSGEMPSDEEDPGKLFPGKKKGFRLGKR